MSGGTRMTIKTMTTYRRADGEPIGGEYAFVTDREWFEDADEFENYGEIIEEVWTLHTTKTIKVGPTERWCETCDEDVTTPEPIDGPVYCGEHKSGAPE